MSIIINFTRLSEPIYTIYIQHILSTLFVLTSFRMSIRPGLFNSFNDIPGTGHGDRHHTHDSTEVVPGLIAAQMVDVVIRVFSTNIRYVLK